MECILNLRTIEFGKSIDVVIIVGRQAEVLCEVDNAHISRYVVLGQELCALAVTKAEEDNVHLIKGKFVSKAKIRLSIQAFVYVGQ